MSFIRKLCVKHFGEAALVRHYAPEETVAMGLAHWGRIYLNTTAFAEEVNAFCERQLPEIVRMHSSSLVQPLVEEIADRLTKQVIEPVLRKWGEGLIETLAEIDSIIAEKAETWMKSEESQKILETVIGKNIRLVASDINDLTREICDKYSIPYRSLRLGPGISLKSAQMSITVKKPFEGFTSSAFVVGVIIMLIAYIPAKAALASGNIPTWVALLSIGGLVSTFGPLLLDEKIKGWNVPSWIREKVLTEEKISETVEEAVPSLKKKIEDALNEEQLDNITQAISEHLKRELNKRANEVKRIIS